MEYYIVATENGIEMPLDQKLGGPWKCLHDAVQMRKISKSRNKPFAGYFPVQLPT
jgi:hypothetical protein